VHHTILERTIQPLEPSDTAVVAKYRAMWIFALQLFLNFWWSIIFFNPQTPGGALLDMVALIIAIWIAIILFFRISRPAAYLLLPYISWVTFAAVLNFSLWLLNR
jgi:tryptophan-rich sensory protein